VPFAQQPLAQVTAQESGAAGDQDLAASVVSAHATRVPSGLFVPWGIYREKRQPRGRIESQPILFFCSRAASCGAVAGRLHAERDEKKVASLSFVSDVSAI
jgi:uncharacterized metal-binding protein